MPRYNLANVRDAHIDPDRTCELCGGPILTRNMTGVCRTTKTCMQENDRRRDKKHDMVLACKVCGTPISRRNKIGICRNTKACRAAAKKEHDRKYHSSHKPEKNDASKAPAPSRPVTPTRPRLHRQTILLPEDGIVDPVAVYIAVNGIRKIAMTHRERVEATHLMLVQGASIREICDNLHVQPGIVREILDELGFECVRNEHVVGSRIMVILPKNRQHGPLLLEPPAPQAQKPLAPRKAA